MRGVFLQMQFKLIGTTLLASLLLSTASILAATTHHVRRHHTTRHKAHVSRVRGQRAIDPQRATQIQQALIKAGYMQGAPSGNWDAQTEAAMRKLQADNGWQTRITPDSRALIKLGLGPSQDAATASVPTAANAGSIGGLSTQAEVGAAN
jgi:hypothetical protein